MCGRNIPLPGTFSTGDAPADDGALGDGAERRVAEGENSDVSPANDEDAMELPEMLIFGRLAGGPPSPPSSDGGIEVGVGAPVAASSCLSGNDCPPLPCFSCQQEDIRTLE